MPIGLVYAARVIIHVIEIPSNSHHEIVSTDLQQVYKKKQQEFPCTGSIPGIWNVFFPCMTAYTVCMPCDSWLCMYIRQVHAIIQSMHVLTL